MTCHLLSTKLLPEPTMTSRPIIYCSLRNSENIEWNIYQNAKLFMQGNDLENVICEMAVILPRPIKCFGRPTGCTYNWMECTHSAQRLCHEARAPFNGFSIAIQIRWKFRFSVISILIQWSLQNFVHGTTAVLSWHVQKFVVIWWPATKLQHSEISVEFELRAKNR